MAKELPYFRFTASEWQNGDISLENYELKGLFMDICAYYWVQDCSITRAILEKRFRNDKELLKELFIIGVLKDEDDFISICFLDEQFDMLSEKRKRRQEAGAIGGRTKSSNAKAKLKQKPSYKDKDKDKDKENNKKWAYNKFYDTELNAIESETEKESYERFVKILFGANSEKIVLDNVLKLEYQLSYEQFHKLMLKKPKLMTFTFVLEKLEFGANKEGKSYLKGRKSLKGIFDTFFKNSY